MHNEKVELDYNCGTETLFLPGCLGLPPHHATSAPPVEKSACRTPFLLTNPAKKCNKRSKIILDDGAYFVNDNLNEKYLSKAYCASIPEFTKKLAKHTA